MRKTLAEIAKLVDGELVGDRETVIIGVCGIKEAGEGHLTFVANPKYFPLVEKTKASAILTPLGMDVPGKSIIRTKDPSLAFSKVLSVIQKEEAPVCRGIHKAAVIADDAVLGCDVSVGACAVIEKGARIGDGTVIGSGTFVGEQAVIGNSCLIYPNVTLREKISLGNNVIIHSGTVVGSDGFGFIEIDGSHRKIPQIGTVLIEDDVEIGANVTIDRARFDKTVIGRGTKIDNLVQIAHNVRVGRNCLIAAQSGIAGSTIIEDNVVLAGQVGVAGHLIIGKGTQVAAQAGVTKSIGPHLRVSGFPARDHAQSQKISATVQRLPIYIRTINELKKRIEDLEKKFKK